MPRFVNPDNSAFQISLNSEIYVDKTELIRYTNSVIESTDAYICDCRPRRFGKSYTANMLAAYYSKGADSLEMFSDLKIGSDAGFKKYLNHYDVIHIDVQWFISACSNRSEFVSYISTEVIKELKEAYPDTLNSNVYHLSDALSQIHEKSGNRFVFIIDEWDLVFRDSSFTELEKNEYIRFLQRLFGGIESEKYIALAWLTGILPIGDENTFTLSKFHSFSTLNSGPLAPFMGFTEDEVIELCSRYRQDYSKVKKWYGGYLLNGCQLFNPKAVCSLMKFHGYRCYWSNTGSYEVITDFLLHNTTHFKQKAYQLLNEEKVKSDIRLFEKVSFQNVTCDAVLTYLVHLGYLGFDEMNGTVFIPNKDVRESWSAAVQ